MTRDRALGIFALLLGVLALTTAVLAWQADRHMPATPSTPPVTTLADLPRPSVTPGVVLTTSRIDVCTPGWASKHRRGLTAKQKVLVLRAYGYPAGQKVAELDHLISLELGGGNSTLNIFPMIDPAQAHRKDRLEGELAHLVCSGKLSLPEAQNRIRTYWDDPLW